MKNISDYGVAGKLKCANATKAINNLRTAIASIRSTLLAHTPPYAKRAEQWNGKLAQFEAASEHPAVQLNKLNPFRLPIE